MQMSAPTRWMNRLNRQRTNSSGDKKSTTSNSPPDFIARSDSYDDTDSGPSTPPLTSSTLSLYSQSSAANSPIGSSGVLKKSWERSFRSFLSRSNNKGAKEDALDVQHRGSYVTPPDSPGHIRPIHSDDIDIPHHGRRHTLDNSPNVRPRENPPNVSDAAVRGGSQFQAVFIKQEPATQRHEKDIHEDNIGPDSRALSKSYEPDSFLDQRGRRFQSCDSLDKQLHKFQDLNVGSKIDRYKLLAPNQRIPEGGLSKISEINSSSMSAPLGGGAAIGPGGIATIAQMGIGNLQLDSNTNYQSHRKKGGVQREMKVAFTEIHNSSVDTKSAFLGDEKSIAGGKVFALMSQENRLARSKSGTVVMQVDQPKPLSQKSYISLLNPVTGTDAWLAGRRYSLLPAIISLAPLETLSVLLGHRNDENFDISSDGKGSILGNTILGEADVSLLHVTPQTPQDYDWSRKKFILAINYLLEYDLSDSYESRPRGYARLDHASAYPHNALDNVMILDVYMVPCARDERKIFLFQLKSKDEMMHWITRIENSTKLQISNFYEYDASDDGMILGTGRYATIRRAKKRQGQIVLKGNLMSENGHETRVDHTNSDTSSSHKGSSRLGIMKKKPSFSSLSMIAQSTDFDCALKIIYKNLFWDRVAKKEERLDAIVRETAVQATLSAFCSDVPLFLKLKTIFETCDYYMMELEFLDGSDLFRYVSSSGHLAEVEAAHIVRDVLVAIHALKRLGIAHRDIKPANIFMVRTSAENENDVRVKLGDFGMAAFVGDDNKLYGRCGTPGYVAPEILSVGVNIGYENKVDLFSLGVTMYILLCGYEPFYGETDEELILANKEAKVDFPDIDWKNVSIEGRDLVEKLLEPDPLKRIDTADALKHPWITRRTTRPVWMEKIMRQ